MISRFTLSMLAVVGAVLAGTTVRAEEGTIPEAHQKRLMDRYGAEGIDANEDGVLTREEVRSFLREEFGEALGPAALRDGRRHRAGRGHDPIGEGLRMLDRVDNALAEKAVVDNDALKADDAVPAIADDRPVRGERMRARLIRHLIELAPEADVDLDGTLDEQELADLRATHRERVKEFVIERHPEADLDGDGVLSDEEFDAFEAERMAQRHQRMLERHPEADLNGDGVLSEDEIDALREEIGPRPRRGFGGARGGRGPIEKGAE